MIQDLQFESAVGWDEVWQLWSEREGIRKEWKGVAREKGWDSWEDWRDAWVGHFDAQNREWERYKILNPLKACPQFRVGPSQSWQEDFPEDLHLLGSFDQLLNYKNYDKNEKVQSILKNFPEATEFIGVIMSDNSIILIEGHHRVAALSLLARHGAPLPIEKKPTIALTRFNSNEEFLLKEMLEAGSVKATTQ